jgi:Na+/H+-dicarboxylate symporter
VHHTSCLFQQLFSDVDIKNKKRLELDLLHFAECFYFTLVSFVVLYWMDIVNPGKSAKSSRLWRFFVGANIAFYSVVLVSVGITINANSHHQEAKKHHADTLPVFITIASLATSVAFLYVANMMRSRVGRLLQGHEKRVDAREEQHLHRALFFLCNTMLYCTFASLLQATLSIIHLTDVDDRHDFKQCSFIYDDSL